MADEHSIIELTVPTADVDDAVAGVCDEWGVGRDAVQVEQLEAAPNTPPDRVRLRITLLAPETEGGFDDDDDMSLDPQLEQARSVLQDLLEHLQVRAEVAAA
jgi:hypothetical protein